MYSCGLKCYKGVQYLGETLIKRNINGEWDGCFKTYT